MNGQELNQPQVIEPKLFPAGHDEATGWPRWFMLPEKTVFITAPEEIVRKGIEAVTAKIETVGDPYGINAREVLDKMGFYEDSMWGRNAREGFQKGLGIWRKLLRLPESPSLQEEPEA